MEEIFETQRITGNEKLLDWTFNCANPECEWRTCHRTRGIAERERERHKSISCPYVHKREEDEMYGKQVIERLWHELDAVTVKILEHKNGTSTLEPLVLENCKGKAQGLAVAIYIQSSPFFADTTAVAKWAVKRYKMDKGEIEVMPTPGVKGYQPPIAPTVSQSRRPAAKAPARKPSRINAMTQAERETIEGGIEMGLDNSTLMRIVKSATPEIIAQIKREMSVSK